MKENSINRIEGKKGEKKKQRKRKLNKYEMRWW